MIFVSVLFWLALTVGNNANYQDNADFAERLALAREMFDPILDGVEPLDPRDPQSELQRSLRAATVEERTSIENMFLREHQTGIEMTKQKVAQMAASNFTSTQILNISSLPQSESSYILRRVSSVLEEMGHYTAQRSLKMGCLAVDNPSSYCENILRNTIDVDISSPPSGL